MVSTSFNGPWKICWENTGAGMGFEEPQAVLPEQRTSGAEIPGRVGAERGEARLAPSKVEQRRSSRHPTWKLSEPSALNVFNCSESLK